MDNLVRVCGNNLVRIQDAGNGSIGENWFHPDRILDYHVLVIVTRGKMRVTEEDTAFTVNENEVVFLKSGMHHWSEKASDSGTKWYWVHFYPNICETCDSLEYCCLDPGCMKQRKERSIVLPKRMHVNLSAEMLEYIRESITKCRSSSSLKRLEARTALMRIFTELVRQSELRSMNNDDLLAEKVKKLIVESEGFGIGSEQIASVLHMNYNYLSQAFCRSTGTTITGYRNRLKILKSIELFKTSNLNIAQVSEFLGFENQFYFSRVFKKITGESPSRYIRSIYRNV